MEGNQEQIIQPPTIPNSTTSASICPFCHLPTTPDECFCPTHAQLYRSLLDMV